MTDEGRCTDDGHPSPSLAEIREWQRELLTEEQQLRCVDADVLMEQDNEYVRDLWDDLADFAW